MFSILFAEHKDESHEKQSLTLSRVVFVGFILELKSTCRERYYCPIFMCI